MKIRVSPYHIISYMWKFSFFFVSLPIQTLVLMLLPNRNVTAYFIATDLLLALLITTCACADYKSIRVRISGAVVSINRGVLFRRCLTITPQSINTTQGPFRKLTKMHKTTLVSANSEVTLFLSRKNYGLLTEFLHCPCTQETHLYSSSVSSLLAMSAGFHNSFSGALSLIPLIKSIKALTNSESLFFLTGGSNPVEHLISGLSPVFSAAAVLIFSLWLAGGVFTFLRFAPLKLYKTRHSLTANQGFLVKRQLCSTPSDLRGLVIRRGLLMLLLRKHYAETLCPLPKGINRTPVICAEDRGRCNRVISALGFPETDSRCAALQPHPLALWGYTLSPVLFLLLTALLLILTDSLTPYKIYPHAGVFVVFWLCAWFFLRVSAHRYSRIHLCENFLLIRSFSQLSLSTAIIPADKIRAAKVTRSVFQRYRGTCTLRVYVKCRKKTSFFIKHTSHKKTAELVEKLCGKVRG